LADVAVILLSDETAVRDRIRGLMTGADEYIGKPYDAAYVVASAQLLLRRGDPQPSSAQPAILLIDDSPTFRAAMKRTLEEAGYRTLEAGSGEVGLRLAAVARPDAIIVDRLLPGLDGVGVLRSIRTDAALRQIPALLLTASEEERDEVVALEAGADAFVRKDGDAAILLARLAAMLRQAQGGGRATGPSLQSPKRILVVDSDENYLRQATAGLREAGYEMVQARSGEEAFDLLSAQPVDCILLALDLPGIGSREACRRIKSVPFASATPVIVTGGEDRDAMLRCLEAGADDMIGKEADTAVLRARVQAQIRRRQFEDENRLFRAELARKEEEAARARAAEQRGALRDQELERCRAQRALAEWSQRLAKGARWVAMDVAAARLDGEIGRALDGVVTALGHAQRTAAADAPQAGHLCELLERAAGLAGQASAAITSFRAALALPMADRREEDINALVREIAALGMAAGWPAEWKLALAPALPLLAVQRDLIQYVLLIVMESLMADGNVGQERQVLTEADEETIRVTLRGDDLRETSLKPSGDDLAICRAIVAAHGGQLWTEKAAISFTLPVSR
jgi:DNA-binding response OmpR family regulator